jgi:hypothetical protein
MINSHAVTMNNSSRQAGRQAIAMPISSRPAGNQQQQAGRQSAAAGRRQTAAAAAISSRLTPAAPLTHEEDAVVQRSAQAALVAVLQHQPHLQPAHITHVTYVTLQAAFIAVLQHQPHLRPYRS